LITLHDFFLKALGRPHYPARRINITMPYRRAAATIII
jgi:hypothetical protein